MKMTSKSRALDKIYKRRDRYDIPDWQRQEVWSDSKKQNLIDTILRGWKLPKFYFLLVDADPETFEVVDGQQRLMAIFEFFDDNLELPKALTKLYGGPTYSELLDPVQDRFDDYEIQYDQIDDTSEKDVKEYFQRLQAGLPLTSSEKLNSVHSRFRDFCVSQAKHTFFKDKTTVSDKRFGHFDILAKCAAIEVDGLEVGLRYDDLHAVFISQGSFSPNSTVARLVRSALGYLNTAFASRNAKLRNRTIVQSLITLAVSIVGTRKEKGTEKRFAAFFDAFMNELSKQVQLGHSATDPDYIDFQKTVSANIRTGPKTRQQILARKLFLYDSTFMNLFEPTQVLESGLSQGIQANAVHIANLIELINTKYSAVNGKDLFKMTNKTTKAIRSLGSVVDNENSYKGFIDGLYFTFWEGTGQRLAGLEPMSFKDINSLRTLEHHDVDHGKGKKIKAKSKQLSQTFRKYGGAASPVSLGPEQFAIMQMKLYIGLIKDLQHLQAAV